jgi:hypothetical protein
MATGNRNASVFKPKTSTFAALGSRLHHVGKVAYISLYGLCIEFISNEDAPADSRHVDIFTLDETCALFRLPCRVVHQSAAKPPGFPKDPGNGFIARRCELNFLDLNSEQWEKLARFIEEFTVMEPAPPSREYTAGDPKK